MHVVISLDENACTRVGHFLLKPPTTEKYPALKKKLLDTYTIDDNQRADSLLDIAGLGDKTPSQLMDSMLVLLSHHELGNFVKLNEYIVWKTTVKIFLRNVSLLHSTVILAYISQ